jgi:hypothetical protein
MNGHADLTSAIGGHVGMALDLCRSGGSGSRQGQKDETRQENGEYTDAAQLPHPLSFYFDLFYHAAG